MGVGEHMHFHVYTLCCAPHACTYRVVHPLLEVGGNIDKA